MHPCLIPAADPTHAREQHCNKFVRARCCTLPTVFEPRLVNTPAACRRFFYAASVPLLVVAIIYGLRYMPSRRTSWTVKLDVGIAWFAALSTLVLVPTDVATAMQVDKHVWLADLWLNRA